MFLWLLYENLKASILWCSAFFMVQFSHSYQKKHSFDYTDLCQKSGVFAFLIRCLGLSQFFFQGASIFSFNGCSHMPHGTAKKKNFFNFLFKKKRNDGVEGGMVANGGNEKSPLTLIFRSRTLEHQSLHQQSFL